MRRIRTFIAVELGGNVTGQATKLIRTLQKTGVEANWAPVTQMHLTLKFLGEITEAEMVDVCRVVQSATAEVESFEIIFRGAGAFPSLANPKTLWIGVDDGAESLIELQSTIEAALYKELRYPREHRRFTPHLTIGRVKRDNDLEPLVEALAANADFDADLCVVDEVITFSSTLTSNGPLYEALAVAPLK
jgi:RNA 2',3'-cyclic 3'-phosphodiesterase